MKFTKLLILPIIASLFVGCGAGTSKNDNVTPTAQIEHIKLGLLTTVDNVPFFYAVNEGIIGKNGVNIDVHHFSSAEERDSAVREGQLNATDSDFITTAVFNQAGLDFKITSNHYTMLGLVSSPQSNLTTLEELDGKDILLSSNSYMEYIVDAMLKSRSISQGSVVKISVPSTENRLNLLTTEQATAAILPEPFYGDAVKQGANTLMTNVDVNLQPVIISIKNDYLQENSATVEAFYTAYNDAVELLNKGEYGDSEAYIKEILGLPADAELVLPQYLTYQVPSEESFNNAMEWCLQKGLIEQLPAYNDVVVEIIK